MTSSFSPLSLEAVAFIQQSIADNGMRAALRRASTDPDAPGDRPCRIMLQEYSAEEKAGKLYNPADIKIALSADGLSIAPDQDKDQLIVFVEPGADLPAETQRMKLFAPPALIAPAGVPAGWRLQARRVT